MKKQSWIVSIITPVTRSFRNHSDILICCWKNYYYYDVENSWVEFFRFLWWIKSSEEQHLSEIEIFCNIINVCIITFDQFKPFLLNKSIHFYDFLKKKINKSNNSSSLQWHMILQKSFYYADLVLKKHVLLLLLSMLKTVGLLFFWKP